MTYETCLKLAENCRKHNDEAGAKMYEERAKIKKQILGIKDEPKAKKE
jgi:hypothetical protein